MIKVDGKKIAERIKAEIKEFIKGESEEKTLAIFYVGVNPVIDSYVSLKEKMGESLGIKVSVLRFPNDVSEENLIEEITKANEKYSGIIVQLPLPENLNKERVLNSVAPARDVDVLSGESFKLFSLGKIKKIPPVVAAITEIFKEYDVDLRNKKIVIVGFGALVGRPLAAWFDLGEFPYEVLDSSEKNAEIILKNSDIIISGVGIPGLIKSSSVKDGAILIDAGTSTSSGKMKGDIEPEAYDKASLASTVPGGVGPITVVSLFKNLFLD